MVRAEAPWMLGFAVLCGVNVGCSSDDSSNGDPTDLPIELSQLCTELATADCARLSACAMGIPFDMDSCQTRQAEVWCAPLAQAVVDAVGASALTYDSVLAKACRDAIGGLSCDVGVVSHDLFAIEACQAMVAVQAEADTPCALSFACAEGHYCAVDNACPGACTPYLANNEACTGEIRCAPDLFCHLTQMRCLTRSSIDATCDPSRQGNACIEGAFCDVSQPGGAVCRVGRGRNQGCQNDFECAGGARCVQNTCSAGLDGDRCGLGFACVPGLLCANGRCAVPLDQNAECSPGGAPCTEGTTCTSSAGVERCAVTARLGDSCAPDEPSEPPKPCYLSRCVDETCVALSLDGESCTADEACLPGRTCNGVCEVDNFLCR